MKILYSLVILLSLCSCVSNDDIVVDNVNEIKMGAFSLKNMMIYADLDVVNTAPLAAKLRDVEIVIYNDKDRLASLTLTEDVKIHKGVNENVILPVRIEIKGGLLSFGMLNNIDPNSLTVDIYAKFTAPLYRKRINIKGVSLSELSNNRDAAKFLKSIENLF